MCCLVMNCGMRFWHVVAVVFFTWGCPRLSLLWSQLYFMPIAFNFLMALLLAMPSAAVLSVCICVEGWE